jgi:hypothetical protein
MRKGSCNGTFTPSKDAASFQSRPFSGSVGARDGSLLGRLPDPYPGWRANADRVNGDSIQPPRGGETDIVSMSYNGFVVGTGEEFLALQRSVVATDPSKPHPGLSKSFSARIP